MRIETAVPANERLQAYALDRTVIGISLVNVTLRFLMSILRVPLQAISTAIIFGTKQLLRFWGDELSVPVRRKDRCILQLVCLQAYRGTFWS